MGWKDNYRYVKGKRPDLYRRVVGMANGIIASQTDCLNDEVSGMAAMAEEGAMEIVASILKEQGES